MRLAFGQEGPRRMQAAVGDSFMYQSDESERKAEIRKFTTLFPMD